MNEKEALDKLKSIHQSHLMQDWSQLFPEEKNNLLNQIDALDLETFLKQQALLKTSQIISSADFQPFTNFHSIGSTADQERGKEALAQGQVGCLIVAGGQGTRLHLNGPKGIYPISNIRKKSLFQLFSEKTLAAGKQVHRRLKTAIMTSPLNHGVTLTYFDAHSLFGLDPHQIDFFCQSMLPFLDDQGNLFLDAPDQIAQGPDGNGSSIHNFYLQGIAEKWKEAGIKYVTFVMIDNPLADPFDAELIGFHIRNKNDMTIKCTSKIHPDEKVGVLVQKEGKTHVIEYMEMPEQERTATNPDKSLKYNCANISLFCINLSFIEKLCKQKTSLPLHRAYKNAPSLKNKDQKAWKFEYFIFDILPLANHVQALIYPREQCFAPLKNLTGPDSPETVKTALQKRDIQIYQDLFGKPAPPAPFELSQDFYYPLPSYIESWKDKPLSNDHYLGSV